MLAYCDTSSAFNAELGQASLEVPLLGVFLRCAILRCPFPGALRISPLSRLDRPLVLAQALLHWRIVATAVRVAG